MPPTIAAIFFVLVSAGLFWLDRNREVRTSIALWIPVTWLLIACSRPISVWLQMAPTDTASQVLDGSPLDRLVYSALIVLGIIALIPRGRRVSKLLWSNGPILLFFLYCAMSLVWSDFPDVGFKRWTKAVGDLVMVLIVLSDREPLTAFKRILARVSYVLIPISILLIKYYPSLGTGYGPWGGKTVYTGVTTNKNTLGVICLCFGLASVWRLMMEYKAPKSAERRRRMIAQAMFLFMIFWLFRVANSMTSLNAFLMGSILLFAANSRLVIRRPALVHFLIAAMVAVSSAVLFLGVDPSVLETMGRNPTLTDRTDVWGALLSLVKNPILGTGFESFWLGPRLESLWNTYWWRPNEAHNGYLEIYLNLGWLGLALLAMVIAWGYRNIFGAWRRNVSNGSLLLAFFLVGLVYNFTEAAFFRMQAPAWIFFLFAVTSVSVLSYGEDHQPQSSRDAWAPLGLREKVV